MCYNKIKYCPGKVISSDFHTLGGNNAYTIDITGAASGIYFVRFTSDNSTIVKRIVVE